MIEQMTARGMRVHATSCGWTVPGVHARSGDPVTSAPARFDQAMVDFAEAYAGRNERDHAALGAAIRDSHIEATPDG